MRNTEDCPDLDAVYRRNNSIVLKRLDKDVTLPIYVHGQCCRYLLPADAPKDSLEYIYHESLISSHTNMKIDHFKMRFLDRKTSFLVDHFNSEGPEITLSMREDRLAMYKLKVSQQVQVEGDPSYQCHLYMAGEYETCLLSHRLTQFHQLLGCSPPWATQQTELWCQARPARSSPNVLNLSICLLGKGSKIPPQ